MYIPNHELASNCIQLKLENLDLLAIHTGLNNEIFRESKKKNYLIK